MVGILFVNTFQKINNFILPQVSGGTKKVGGRSTVRKNPTKGMEENLHRWLFFFIHLVF